MRYIFALQLSKFHVNFGISSPFFNFLPEARQDFKLTKIIKGDKSGRNTRNKTFNIFDFLNLYGINEKGMF